jgi:hypothetical protein
MTSPIIAAAVANKHPKKIKRSILLADRQV